MAPRKGDTVKLTDDAIANYGEHLRNVEFVVTHRASKYMSAAEFFAKGKPEGFHPGYDENAGSPLYDLAFKSTGEPLPMSLYGWELK